MATWTGGGCSHYFHDSPEALRWYQRELSKPRVTQAPHYRRTLHMLLGEALARAGDLAGARRLYTGATHTQILARQLFYEGRWDEAEAAIEDQMPKLRNFGDLASLAACLEILANICRLSGRPQKALALFKEYFATAGSEIAVVNEILVRPIIASICVQISHLDAAERELVRCREIMALGEDWRGLAGFVVCAEAVVAAATGKCEEAEAQFEKAVDIFRRYQVPFEEAEALHYWGRALNAAGERVARMRSSTPRSRFTSVMAAASAGSIVRSLSKHASSCRPRPRPFLINASQITSAYSGARASTGRSGTAE